MSNASFSMDGRAAVAVAELDGPPRQEVSPPHFDRLPFLRALPRLGNVLWLTCGRKASSAAVSASAIDLDDECLWPLAAFSRARGRHAITPAGPREWIDFAGVEGRILAKLFLLPDTDYFAWDEFVAPLSETPPPQVAAGWNAHLAFQRSALRRLGASWRACLLRFELAGDPWHPRLRRCRKGHASLLDLEVAVAIARAEGAFLSAPESG
jgi:hypothetical protein